MLKIFSFIQIVSNSISILKSQIIVTIDTGIINSVNIDLSHEQLEILYLFSPTTFSILMRKSINAFKIDPTSELSLEFDDSNFQVNLDLYLVVANSCTIQKQKNTIYPTWMCIQSALLPGYPLVLIWSLSDAGEAVT